MFDKTFLGKKIIYRTETGEDTGIIAGITKATKYYSIYFLIYNEESKKFFNIHNTDVRMK
jgi:hypothetical protein